ncbi:MAG: hypothetical protein M3478_07465, partial [Planctomycetota bacterium]|nr:hypothetical protein [Planctomycetota bacterium]
MSRATAQDDAPAAPIEAAPEVAPEVVPAPPEVAAAPEVTNPALAERFAAAAQDSLRSRNAGEPSFRATMALLRAATRLAPTEPRFWRLLAEAVARLGDDKATIDALTAYRTLVPTDHGAQIEQVDLFLRVMETADAKLNYLRTISASDEVAPTVRAHAGFRLSEVLADRAQMTESDEALALALKLDPLNLDALGVSYARLPADAPPERRVAALLALLRSNPAQAQIASVLARELSRVGLTKPAAQWYDTAFRIYMRTGVVPSPPEFLEYAATLYITSDPKGAEHLMSQLVIVNSNYMEAWYLRLIAARALGDKEATERVRKQTAAALTNVLAEIRKAAGEEAATTQPLDPAPADALWPDAAAMLERVKGSDKPELLEAFADAALSAAWYLTYFEEKPDQAQPWINVLRGLLVEGSQTVARLEGWAFLLSNKPDEARVKLSAAAETDPLAALGLIRLAGTDAQAKAAADADAQRLLAEYGYGLTGATLADALAFRGIKPRPSEASKPVTDELAKFPATFTRILDAPGAFYSLRVEPVRISHQFGEAMLVRVTIQNNSEFDLTVGPDGIIRSDLWIDAQLRGIANQAFPGVAFDRLSGPVVLPAKKAMSQVILASQGPLAGFLAANPTPSFQMSFTVMTNPSSARGAVEPGPAGQRVTGGRLVERRGTPNNAAMLEQRALDAMSNDPPAERVRVVELVATFAALLGRQEPTDAVKAAAGALRDVLRRGTADADPTVRAWAMYCNAMAG